MPTAHAGAATPGAGPPGPDRARAAAAVLGALFAALTAAVALGGWVDRLDHAVQHRVAAARSLDQRDLATSALHAVSPGIDVAALLVGTALLLALDRRRTDLCGGGSRARRLVPAVGTALVLLAVSVLGLKHLLHRPAPSFYPAADGGSYPSGHTASFVVCWGTLALLAARAHRPSRVVWCLLGLGTAAVAGLLVLASFHWLSDVVGAALLGGCELALVRLLLGRTPGPGDAATGQPATGTTLVSR